MRCRTRASIRVELAKLDFTHWLRKTAQTSSVRATLRHSTDARTTHGTLGLTFSEVFMNEQAVSTFQQTFRGRLVRPSDADYDAVRALYNGMIDKRPRLIARAVDAADVIAAVNFAREQGLLLAIRGGGHNGPGLGSCDDGLVIDLSMMKSVRVDPASKTVRVEPGCSSADVDHATHAFGLAVPFGIVGSTGVAGLTLGGGTGYLTRKFGLTVDNLLEADVVLADGRFVTANAKENPDLFWALRGGGGNFGVVTSFLFQAHPVKMVFAGPIFWDAAKDGKAVMLAFRDFLARGARGPRHVRRPEDGAADRSVPEGALEQARVRRDLVLQRLGGGRPEGDGAAAREPAGAALQLDGHDADAGDQRAVRSVLPEGPAVVLEGRLREVADATRRSTCTSRRRRRRRARSASCTCTRSTVPCGASQRTPRRGRRATRRIRW